MPENKIEGVEAAGGYPVTNVTKTPTTPNYIPVAPPKKLTLSDDTDGTAESKTVAKKRQQELLLQELLTKGELEELHALRNRGQRSIS